MSETSTAGHQTKLLSLFSAKPNERLTAGKLTEKLGKGAKEIPDAEEVDRAFEDLIDQGLITVSGASKNGLHPRKNGSYRLTDQGKHHVRPPKPAMPDSQLETQEAFILLQVFRNKERKLTRSELNGKLKTKAAVGQLEFDVKEAPRTIDYHLANLVEKGLLDEQRKGVSTSYLLNPEQGATALASMKQHPTVSFTMTGETLNALLTAARLRPSEGVVEESVPEPALMPTPVSKARTVDHSEISQYIDQLRSEKYAGKDLIPIHEVRRLVAQHHGHEAASHQAFDPVLRQMRSDGHLNLIAISDGRDASQQEMDDSIPGLNEIIFYIVVQ